MFQTNEHQNGIQWTDTAQGHGHSLTHQKAAENGQVKSFLEIVHVQSVQCPNPDQEAGGILGTAGSQADEGQVLNACVKDRAGG